MPITEEHFLGWNPTLGYDHFSTCPGYHVPTTIVWFEKWSFFGWSWGVRSATGIVYSHCYASFDMLGNCISTSPIGPSCCGFLANETCWFWQHCPTNDEWLDRARAACAPAGLPPPGTIELNPTFIGDYGRKPF